MKQGRLLLVDDQEDILTALELLFKTEGFQVVRATFPSEAIEKLKQDDFDLILMDMNYSRDTTSGGEGLDLIQDIRQIDPNMPVVVMTAWGTVELASAFWTAVARHRFGYHSQMSKHSSDNPTSVAPKPAQPNQFLHQITLPRERIPGSH